MIDYIGLVFLAAWAINVWVFLGILSARPGLTRTCIWAVVLFFPVIGYLVWLILGRRIAGRK